MLKKCILQLNMQIFKILYKNENVILCKIIKIKSENYNNWYFTW